MAEHVGFITNMKPEWMDLAYRCRIDGLTKEDAKPIIEDQKRTRNHVLRLSIMAA